MSDTRRLYQLGRHVSFTIFGGVEDPATGVIAWTSIGALGGVAETADIDLAANLENIQAGDTGDGNWVKLGSDWDFSLTGIKVKLLSKLRQLVMGYDLAKVVVTTADETWTFIGSIDKGGWSFARGKNPEKFSIKRVDLIGAANPTVVVGP